MNASSATVKMNKYTVLLVTTIATFLIPLMSSGVNVALKKISDEFHMDAITLGWVSTSYMLASAALMIPFGKLADVYGRRKFFIGGILVFLVGSVLTIVSTTGTMLLASRAVQGVGGSALFATSMAILTSAFPPEERGKALGINTAAVYLGLSLGPPIGGLMTEHWGWKSIFVMTALLTAIVAVATFWKLKGELTAPTKTKFDLPGAILYALALMLVMYGVSELPETKALWVIGAGLVLTIGFFLLEVRVQNPVLDLRMFKGNRSYTFSNLAALVNYSGTWAVSFLMSLYLQYARDFDPGMTGLVLVSSPVVQAAFSPLFGRWSDRMEPRILASLGMAATALGIAMLAFVTKTTPMVYIISALGIVGFGFAMFSSPNTNAIMASAAREHYGVASATVATMRQLGMMVSMAIVWVVFAIIIGRVEITKEVEDELVRSVRIAFLISAGLCLGAIFFSLSRGNIHAHAHEETTKKPPPDH